MNAGARLISAISTTGGAIQGGDRLITDLNIIQAGPLGPPYAYIAPGVMPYGGYVPFGIGVTPDGTFYATDTSTAYPYPQQIQGGNDENGHIPITHAQSLAFYTSGIGNIIYVSGNNGADTITAIQGENINGSSPILGPYASGSGMGVGLAVSGNYLYAGVGSAVKVWSIGYSFGGALTAQPGLTTGLAAVPGWMTAVTGWLYIGMPTLNEILQYSCDISTGALTYVATFSLSGYPAGLASDQHDLYVSVPGTAPGDYSINQLQWYSVDPSTGALTLVTYADCGTNNSQPNAPQAITFGNGAIYAAMREGGIQTFTPVAANTGSRLASLLAYYALPSPLNWDGRHVSAFVNPSVQAPFVGPTGTGPGSTGPTWQSHSYDPSLLGADDPTIPPVVVCTSFRVIVGTLPTPTTTVVNGLPVTVINPNLLVTGDVDLSPFLTSLNFEMNLGKKWTFNATFVEHDNDGGELGSAGNVTNTTLTQTLASLASDLNPYYYGTAAYANTVLHHKFDVSRQIIIKLTVIKNGQLTTYTSPPFAPGVPHFDGYTLTWSGQDLSVIFEQEYQSINPDITPRSPLIYMAQDTIQKIGAQYGFSNFNFQFQDYRIRELRRTKEQPINWIHKILRARQALTNWRNGLWTFEVPPNPDSALPQATYTDVMIEETGFSLVFNDQWKNKFTLSRLADNGGQYGSQTCTGGHCIGRTVNIKLSAPINNITLRTEYVGPAYIVPSSVTYWSGNTAISSGFSYQGSAMIDRIEATFMPNWNQVTAFVPSGAGIGQTIPYAADYGYTVYVNGGASIGAFSSTYSYRILDGVPPYVAIGRAKLPGDFGGPPLSGVTTGSVPLFGVRPDYTNIEDPIIPDIIVAQAYLKAVLAQNMRKVWKLNFETRFINPSVLPGDCIAIADYLTTTEGSDSSTVTTVNWLVEKIVWVIDEAGDAIQKFECYRGIMPS